jgi:hypothetical protein
VADALAVGQNSAFAFEGGGIMHCRTRAWAWRTAVAGLVLLAGCASTKLVNQWTSQGHTNAPLRKVVVVGVSKQPSVRRVFEDEFASRLQVARVEAVPSYTLVAEDGQADPAVLEKAVAQVGADGVLVTRLVSVQQKTDVSPGFYRPVPAMGFHGWYSSAWMGYYEPPTVYQYDVVTAETSLYSPPQSTLVWSGTTETFSPRDVRKETAGFADVIIGALRKQGII